MKKQSMLLFYFIIAIINSTDEIEKTKDTRNYRELRDY